MSERIRIFDVETTGTNPAEDRVVEIAACDLDLLTRLVSPYDSAFINPGRPIPAVASAVHHIRDKHVADAELFGARWPRFWDREIAIFAAHNCAFEQDFLPCPAGVTWICTYKCALRAWPDAPAHNNQALRYWRGLDDRPEFNSELARLAHRAGPDAYVTGHLLADLLQDHTVDQLIQWTAEPKAYAALTFGKHRGQKWADVPFDYLQWLRDGRHDMDADWRHGAKVEITRRLERSA